jgi:hypothetical protein
MADVCWLAELDELRDIALEGVDPRLRLLTARQVTTLLVFDRNALSSPARRRRIGLPAVHVGRVVRFRMVDVARLIAKGMEFPSAAPGDCGEPEARAAGNAADEG